MLIFWVKARNICLPIVRQFYRQFTIVTKIKLLINTIENFVSDADELQIVMQCFGY